MADGSTLDRFATVDAQRIVGQVIRSAASAIRERIVRVGHEVAALSRVSAVHVSKVGASHKVARSRWNSFFGMGL